MTPTPTVSDRIREIHAACERAGPAWGPFGEAVALLPLVQDLVVAADLADESGGCALCHRWFDPDEDTRCGCAGDLARFHLAEALDAITTHLNPPPEEEERDPCDRCGRPSVRVVTVEMVGGENDERWLETFPVCEECAE